jgi:hypothetical protein
MSDLARGFKIGCGILAAVVGIPAVLGWGCLILSLAAVQNAERAQQASKAQIAAERTPAKQEARKQLIAKLRAKGVFNRIENRGGGLVRAWTGPAFDGLDVQTKESFCGVVYAYHFDGQTLGDAVILHDGRTGKHVGHFTRYGLRMN